MDCNKKQKQQPQQKEAAAAIKIATNMQSIGNRRQAASSFMQ